jgi:hypothetical protein
MVTKDISSTARHKGNTKGHLNRCTASKGHHKGTASNDRKGVEVEDA